MTKMTDEDRQICIEAVLEKRTDLPKEAIDLFYKPFTLKQAEQLANGFINNLKYDDVLCFANTNLSPEEMRKVRLLLESNLDYVIKNIDE